jgi:DNA polymerase elongation subunit (family B)
MKFYTNVYSYGNKILVRYNKNGLKEQNEIYFGPSVFLPSTKSTKFKSIYGQSLSEMTFNNKDEYVEFINQYSDVNGLEIHGEIGIEYQYIRKHYEKNEHDISKLDVLYLDIETTCENGFPNIENPEEKVIAITVKRKDKTPVVFCLGNYKGKEDVRIYSDEQRLLSDFISYLSNDYPDIITGWSVRFFDIPYLYNRIVKLFGVKYAKQLSPWNIIRDKTVNRNGYDNKVYDIIGISTLDYYELYKTFTYTNQESYKLDHIANIELGERKLSYDEYETIQDFYKGNFQKFIEYNIQDVILVEKLENKLKLMELAVSLAYSAGVNFNDVFSQVKTWDVIIYNFLMDKNIIIPPKKKSSKDEQYAGAYVKEPLVGLHNWVVSFDLNSLYPHLIMQYNISPETATNEGLRGVISPEGVLTNGAVTMKTLNENKEKNLSTAANGTTYQKNVRGFLPELMDKMYKDRKMFKNKMIEAKKQLEQVNLEIKNRGLDT